MGGVGNPMNVPYGVGVPFINPCEMDKAGL
jgi:hypothetical protein